MQPYTIYNPILVVSIFFSVVPILPQCNPKGVGDSNDGETDWKKVDNATDNSVI